MAEAMPWWPVGSMPLCAGECQLSSKVKSGPPDEYCCPFTLTSTLRADTPDCTGVAHSTSLESMYRAATDTPLPRPKRHASVVVSLK